MANVSVQKASMENFVRNVSTAAHMHAFYKVCKPYMLCLYYIYMCKELNGNLKKCNLMHMHTISYI